MHLIKIR